jgi:hypothetical protein
MQCAKFKIDQCLLTTECYVICSALDCYKGDNATFFKEIAVPKDIAYEQAKNLCIYYATLDPVPCHNCQIYSDIL